MTVRICGILSLLSVALFVLLCGSTHSAVDSIGGALSSDADAKPDTCPKSIGFRKNPCKKIGPHACTVDRNCPLKQKCCGCPRVCADSVPAQPFIKPGRCPRFNPNRKPPRCAFMIVLDLCAHDLDCPAHQKCCQANRCGGKECKKKIKRARGRKPLRGRINKAI